MRQKPSQALLLEAYLELGTRKKPWPGTEYQRLVDLVGASAAAVEARELDAILASIVDVPEVRDAPTLTDVSNQATALAKALHPDFSDSLCDEIGRYASYQWR
jgi:hypothetical protein